LGDPRTGLLGISAGVGVLTAGFMAVVLGHLYPLPLVVLVPSVLLLLNLRGGPLRMPLAAVQAAVLGVLTTFLLWNGTGVVTLIGCVTACAALFYRPPAPGAPVPGWLQDRRHRRRAAADGAAAPPDR
jgi:hypothetical protein